MNYLCVDDLPPPAAEKSGWPWTESYPSLPKTADNGHPWPLISVVTPSYQHGQFLEETIRSVLLQGYPNLEYIIIDGGSTDQTLDVIKAYSPFLTHWVSEPDRGQGHAVNKGWAIANGRILGWLNSDDLYLPGALHRVAQTFMQQPQTELVSGHVSGRTIDLIEYRRKPPVDFDLNYLLWFSNLGPGQPGIFLTSDLHRKIGPIDEHLYYTLDREYWMRICRLHPDLNYVTLDDDIAISREYQGNKSSSKSLKIFFERLEILDSVFSQPDLPLAIKRLEPHVYCAAYHSIANKFLQDDQRAEAFHYLFKAIRLKPYILLKNPAMRASVAHLLSIR